MAEMFNHYALIADGAVVDSRPAYQTSPGPCILSMKVWAESVEQAVDMMCSVGDESGFQIADKVEVITTEPDRPAADDPYAYDVKFSSYRAEGETVQ